MERLLSKEWKERVDRLNANELLGDVKGQSHVQLHLNSCLHRQWDVRVCWIQAKSALISLWPSAADDTRKKEKFTSYYKSCISETFQHVRILFLFYLVDTNMNKSCIQGYKMFKYAVILSSVFLFPHFQIYDSRSYLSPQKEQVVIVTLIKGFVWGEKLHMLQCFCPHRQIPFMNL